MAYTSTNSIQTPAYSKKLDPTQKAESIAVVREEVVEAVHGLKAGTSSRVDNIRSELLKNGSESTTTVLTAIRQKTLETKKWPKELAQSLVIPLPKIGNLKQCQNYPTISLISHPA